MVTLQSGPSFFRRYQAVIRPPGPPPTIARSNICPFLKRGRAPSVMPVRRQPRAPIRKRFSPERKMNKPGMARLNVGNRKELALITPVLSALRDKFGRCGSARRYPRTQTGPIEQDAEDPG